MWEGLFAVIQLSRNTERMHLHKTKRVSTDIVHFLHNGTFKKEAKILLILILYKKNIDSTLLNHNCYVNETSTLVHHCTILPDAVDTELVPM